MEHPKHSIVDLPSFMQNLMLIQCLILSSTADKMKLKVEKCSCKNNKCSQHSDMWQTDVIGWWKCELEPPLIFFHQGGKIITIWELSDKPLILKVQIENTVIVNTRSFIISTLRQV
jgi:hypothetical protein